MTPPPVLHVISGLRTGGAETMLVALTRTLQARGLPQAVVALSGGPNEAVLRAAGIPVQVLAPRGLPGAAATLLALARRIRATRPGVVQGWLYHGDLFAAAAHRLAGAPRATRLAWGLRNSDIDAARYGRLLALARRVSGWPDVVIANSRAGADFHLAQGYRPRRLAVVPNGIDTDTFRPDRAARAAVRAELGATCGAVVAVHAARLDPMKDHAGLIAAAGAVPEVTVWLAGAGTESLAGLPPNVRALGRRDDLPRLYAAGDLVVSSSAFGEGFSNALAEGMACGLVAVATDVGDAAAILDGHGHVLPPRDPAALAAALRAAAARPDRAAAGLA
ncbi:glycosyltransferase, partial [Methylobacterium crusticola]